MALEGYQKVAHRYDQYNQSEVTIWLKKGGVDDPRPYFVIECDETFTEPFTLNQLQTIQDCLKNDLDLKRKSVL